MPHVHCNEPTIPPPSQQQLPVNPGVNVVQPPSNPAYPI